MTTITVTIGKLGTTTSLDTAKLPAESVAYLLWYGANQSVNDAHASVQRKNFSGPAAESEFAKAVTEKTEARLRQIREGTVRMAVSQPVTDEVAIRHLAQSMGMTPEQVLSAIEAQKAKKRA